MRQSSDDSQTHPEELTYPKSLPKKIEDLRQLLDALIKESECVEGNSEILWRTTGNSVGQLHDIDPLQSIMANNEAIYSAREFCSLLIEHMDNVPKLAHLAELSIFYNKLPTQNLPLILQCEVDNISDIELTKVKKQNKEQKTRRAMAAIAKKRLFKEINLYIARTKVREAIDLFVYRQQGFVCKPQTEHKP